MAPSGSIKKHGSGSNARPPNFQLLDWDGMRETILGLYEVQNRPLREVRQTMKKQYNFDASERMYKTRFKKWAVRKYHTEHEQQKRRSPGTKTEKAKPALSFPGVASSPAGLATPAPPGSHLLPHRALAPVTVTPTGSQYTNMTPSSGKGRMLTPESSCPGDGYAMSPSASSGSLPLLLNIGHVGTGVPGYLRTAYVDVHGGQSDDDSVTSQISEQVMGLFDPLSSPVGTPSKEFQKLMEARISPSDCRSEELSALPDATQSYHQGLETQAPKPETWVALCYKINIWLGQGRISEARHAKKCAALVYGKLVQDGNDQLLSILSLILANFFLLDKSALAAGLLSQAQKAASEHLNDEDPILVSIEFMVAMALRKARSTAIRNLRHVAGAMRRTWGGNHRYCITADYHLAWRLAMERGGRREALEILRVTQVRAEQVFDPVHLQTVAILTAQARVLLHLAQYGEAEKVMSEALARIRQWNIKEDYPIYLEATRRHKIFLEELSRLQS